MFCDTGVVVGFLDIPMVVVYCHVGVAAYVHCHHLGPPPPLTLVIPPPDQARKAVLEAKSKTAVLDQYGNAAAPKPEDLALLAQSEAYVEYDKTGKVVKGQEVKVGDVDGDVGRDAGCCLFGFWCVCKHRVLRHAHVRPSLHRR